MQCQQYLFIYLFLVLCALFWLKSLLIYGWNLFIHFHTHHKQTRCRQHLFRSLYVCLCALFFFFNFTCLLAFFYSVFELFFSLRSLITIIYYTLWFWGNTFDFSMRQTGSSSSFIDLIFVNIWLGVYLQFEKKWKKKQITPKIAGWICEMDLYGFPFNHNLHNTQTTTNCNFRYLILITYAK